MGKNIKQQILSGIGWTVIEKLLQQGTNVIVTILLVRLLSPDDFGLVAMVIVFVGFGNILVESGFRAFIIQEKNISTTNLSSILWFNIGIAICLSLVFIFLAPSIAKFYGYDELEYIVYLISPQFLLYAFQIVPYSILSKKMEFRGLAKKTSTANIVGGGVGIFMAFLGFGFWSLLFQTLAKNMSLNIFLWYKFNWKPTLEFSPTYIKKSLKLSSSIMTNGVLGYFVDNIDNLLIGKYIGKASLGFYSKSYSIINLAAVNIRSVINRVVFPALVKIQDDPISMSNILFGAMRNILAISIPLMIIISINANSFTLLVFGVNWKEIVPLVELFAIGAIFYSINNLFISILIVKNKTKLIYQSTFLRRGIVLSSLLISFSFGLKAIAFSRVIAEFLNLLLAFFYLRKTLGVKIITQISFLLPFFTSGFLAASIIVYFIQYTFSGILAVQFLIDATIFMVLYLSIIRFLFTKDYQIYRRFINHSKQSLVSLLS